MTKTEMLKSLDDTSPRLELIRSVRNLEGMIKELSEGLEKVSGLKEDIRKILEAYDMVTEAQRKTLDILVHELGRKTSEVIEKKVERLDDSILQLADGTKALTQAIEKVRDIPGRLKETAGDLERLRPRWWRQAVGLILAGVIGAVVVLSGQGALKGLGDREAIKKAQVLDMLERKATKEEIDLMNRILQR